MDSSMPENLSAVPHYLLPPHRHKLSVSSMTWYPLELMASSFRLGGMKINAR